MSWAEDFVTFAYLFYAVKKIKKKYETNTFYAKT